MYKALYRKYRPQTFSDVYGQDHITEVLRKQCAEGHISHAYLFCGTRGTGKTTSAKILAKAVNCLDPHDGEPCGLCDACTAIDSGTATDVLELDAASNNSVDDIRALCDELVYPPSVLKKRVYIIDEVHMLSASAYNALLKTLEEPPEYIVFILATTELNKIPPTVLSRCQRYEFRRIPPEILQKRLQYVARQEQIALEPDAAALLSRLADGAARDALSLLESCITAADGQPVTASVVAQQLGLSNDDTPGKILLCAARKDTHGALSLLESAYASAKSLTALLNDMLESVRDALLRKLGDLDTFSSLPENDLKELSALPKELLLYYASQLESTITSLSRYAFGKKLSVEMLLIRLCDPALSDAPENLLARIGNLETRIAGNLSSASVSIPPSSRPAAPTAPNPSAAPTSSASQATPAAPSLPPEPQAVRQTVSAKPSGVSEAYPLEAELREALHTHASLAGMIKAAVFRAEGNTLALYVSPFAKNLLEKPQTMAELQQVTASVDNTNPTLVIRDKATLAEITARPIDEVHG